jgi:cyclohexyl-isocyanide hydratase
MNRRELTLAMGALAASVRLRPALAQDAAALRPTSEPSRPKVAMLVHPDMVLLDLVGPQTVLSLAMAEIHLVWKNTQPVPTDVGLAIAPTTTFPNCPHDLDVLFVPGGLKGSVALMNDSEVLAFLADHGERARYVTSVCTGSLVLGAAGLLKGFRATSHWYVRDILSVMGATVEHERVVTDRNRITGGGVTAGIDFGFVLAALMRGEDYARRIQLVLEYDPQPPFNAGTPDKAGAPLAAEIRDRRAPLIMAAAEAARTARTRLGI